MEIFLTGLRKYVKKLPEYAIEVMCLPPRDSVFDNTFVSKLPMKNNRKISNFPIKLRLMSIGVMNRVTHLFD